MPFEESPIFRRVEMIEKGLPDNQLDDSQAAFNLFPEDPILKHKIPESFIINMPKTGDVGGDGFWVYDKGDVIYVTIFDCMGHGHLANMMTRIYRSVLEKVIIKTEIEYAGSILQYIHREIQAKFEGKEQRQIATGADFGIVKIDKSARQMEFAGAKIDLIQIDNGKLDLIRGDRMQVGDMFDFRHQYHSNTIELGETPRTYYLTTDGARNIVGGSEKRKIGSSDLRTLLQSSAIYSMNEQRQKIANYFTKWQGKNELPDDVLMIGFQI